jgi:uncharacterized protein with LGFP repeats
MALTPRRPRRRLLVRATLTAVVLTLVSTGLIAPAGYSGPVVEDEKHTLATGAVGEGWSKTTDPDLPTQVAAVTWQGKQNGAVEVRALEEGGWGPWLRLEGNPYEGPDPGSREHRAHTAAGPAWISSDADKVEVRVVEGELSGLKLHAIHSEDKRARAGLKPAGAAVSQPGIISRAAWGADESWRRVAPGCNGQPEIAPAVKFSVVHHTVNSNTYAPGDSAAMMRAIYHFHTHTNGWCDVGYNFVVDRHGQIFEGRAGGITQPVVGAHATNFNHGSTGVALLGTFSTDPVPAVMYNALRSVLAWKLDLHAVDPRAVVAHGGKVISTVSGHRDVNPTDCPGNAAYALLPQLRNELAGMVNIAPRSALTAAHSGKVLDLPNNSQTPGTRVVQWSWNGGVNQHWRLVPLGGDVVKIVSVGSGMVLDVGGRSTANGAAIVQWPWHGGANQQWRAVHLGSNLYVFISVHSQKVLDVASISTANGAAIQQWTWNGGANQIWIRGNF